MSSAHKKTVLLVVAVLSNACGPGISPDPLDRPQPGDIGRDGSPTEAEDGSPSDDVGAGRDTSIGEDGAGFDGRTDAERLDRTGDSGVSDSDVARDGPADASMERSADVEIDRDAAIDAGVDRSMDAGVDRDAPRADPDSGDMSIVSTDAPKDADLEVITADIIDGCTVGCGQAEFDYYVDAGAPPGGDGSKAAPFRTISAAVEAHAHVPNQARKAHVAAGTYDEALGEIFPLVLRGLSLQGAGADKTLIVGSGTFDHAGQGGPKNQQYMVTIVGGDRSLPTKVSRLSLRPPGPVPVLGYYGLFCDRGNATGEVASPAGQTQVDEISVGPGYDTGVLVVSSTNPVTGCNMLMTRSTVTGGWTGVEAIGCISVGTPGPVMLQMGTDDPTSGNTVTWMQSEAMGTGVNARSCLVRGSFQHNAISDCNIGMAMIQGSSVPPAPGSPHLVSIKHNTFARMSHQGLIISGDAFFVDEVSDNRFFDTTRIPSPANSYVAPAMRIMSPVVGKVRRNLFVGNDIGLVLGQEAERTDLGRPGDPGGNVFSCNSGIAPWTGSDVMIAYPMPPRYGHPRSQGGTSFVREADGGVDGGDDRLDGGDADTTPMLSFAGNSWDHDPPRVVSEEVADNGVEIRLEWAPPLLFDLSGASLVTTPCPAGRTR
jgi:hypothetical protein